MSIVPTSDTIAAHSAVNPNAARPTTTLLARRLKVMFWTIIRDTRLPIMMLSNTLFRFESVKITSLVVVARPAPLPMAIETSAIAKAGPSLTVEI